MGRLAGEQKNPMKKRCPVHPPSIHGVVFVGGCWIHSSRVLGIFPNNNK
jgi:hypothetical protein